MGSFSSILSVVSNGAKVPGNLDQPRCNNPGIERLLNDKNVGRLAGFQSGGCLILVGAFCC